MMLNEKKLLTDILESIYSINDHLEGKRIFEEYKANKTQRRAVERELEIIGEAVNNLLRLNPIINISFARQIVDLRNKVIHAYDNVNDMVIWGIVINHLPKLEQEVKNLLYI
jgi:uncharacterized protein with HEPN domain